jgi:hypothetical protein
MANVIPKDMRQGTWAHAGARFATVGGVVLLTTALVAGLALLPSYIFLTVGTNTPVVENPTPVKNTGLTDRIGLDRTMGILQQLSPLIVATSTPSMAIARAIELRPLGIRINHMSYTAGTPSTLLLVGSTESNTALSAYRTALLSDARFVTVQVPVEALVGPVSGDFSITISGKF